MEKIFGTEQFETFSLLSQEIKILVKEDGFEICQKKNGCV
jgi:hypothetical protein